MSPHSLDGLKEDLDLNLSVAKDCLSFLKCCLSQRFLLYSSNSFFNFTWFVFLGVNTNFRSLDNNRISEEERFLPERYIKTLLRNLPLTLLPYVKFPNITTFQSNFFFSTIWEMLYTVNFAILFAIVMVILKSLYSIIDLHLVFINFI